MDQQSMNELREIICYAPGTLTLTEVRKMLIDSPTNTGECAHCGKTVHANELHSITDDDSICASCMHTAFVAEQAAAVS